MSFLSALQLTNSSPAVMADDAREFSAEAVEYFEKQVRPLLVKHCSECHSSETGPDNGELILDTPAGIASGGSRGSLTVGKELEASLFWSAVSYGDVSLQMPPEGKLKPKELEIFSRWIEMGTPLPAYTVAPRPAGKRVDIEAGREFWSFQPLSSVTVPEVSPHGPVHQPMDAFILTRLREAGLNLSPAADRRTLIRRVTFDLTGLPPTPEEVEAFLADDAPDAYEQLIDRLLDSPRYGEHWGRFWLDLARYSDVLPSWQQGAGKPWLYRDWVIAAFNRNLPYDEFVRLQLAADLLPETDPTDHAALGFLGISPMYWKELKLAPEVIQVIVADEWEERIDAVSRTFLGLTVACARCHDHKFDPITMEDYYGLAGIFASSQAIHRPLLPEQQAEAVVNAHEQVNRHQTRITDLEGKLKKLNGQVKMLEETAGKAGIPSNTDEVVKNDAASTPSDEDPLQKARDEKRELEVEVAQLKQKIANIQRDVAHFDVPFAHVMREASLYVKPNGKDATRLEYVVAQSQDLPLFRRGNPSNPGPIVPRRFLEVLSTSESAPFTEGSGRQQLASSLFEQSPALAARVFVNRVWGQLFEAGLVRTPSDFGQQGDRPTHPELLDYLAAQFIDNGWNIKQLVRGMVLSATYRQAVAGNPRANEIDPENKLLWRMNRKRLTIEMWRDAMLACAGTLDTQVGGEDVTLSAEDNFRRTMYATVARQSLDATLRMFDFPEASSHSPQRVPTTTPLQQLYVLNAPFMRAQAERILRRLTTTTTPERIAEGYRLLFSREPSPDELAVGQEFLQSETGQEPTPERWRDFVHALLGLNEFHYLD